MTTSILKSKEIQASELPLNSDGSIYHLKLFPHQIAKKVIIVGDQNRVPLVSNHFDHIEFKISNREFVTHTGIYKGEKVSVISTGIGIDNIDIFLNELDALVNIDLEKRVVKDELTRLQIVRLGTSGSLQEYIPVNSFVISQFGFGIDGLMGYYNFEHSETEKNLLDNFLDQVNWLDSYNPAYFAEGTLEFIDQLDNGYFRGITATANGFYGPQGRSLRLDPRDPSLNDQFRNFEFQGMKITNYEMETAALYGLGKLLGHNVCTICAIMANRYKKEFSNQYTATINTLIEQTLEKLVKIP